MRQGVCCTCQSVHPVRPGTEPGNDRSDDDFDRHETDSWVMDTHYPFGGSVRCEGTGTSPQALLAKTS